MASTAGAGDAFTEPTVPLIADDAPAAQAPHASEPQERINAPDSLAVNRDASLTLGTDSLVVLGTMQSTGAQGNLLWLTLDR